MKKNYQEIKSVQPELFECFFAFSNQQFAEGVKNMCLEGQKLFNGTNGLYGTQKGIQKLMDDFDAIEKEIAANCTPQEVYRDEYNNHECSYTCDDSDAFAIVERIFGEERSKEVKRKNAPR